MLFNLCTVNTNSDSLCVRFVSIRQCWLLSRFGLSDGCKLPSLPLGCSPGHFHLPQVRVPSFSFLYSEIREWNVDKHAPLYITLEL